MAGISQFVEVLDEFFDQVDDKFAKAFLKQLRAYTPVRTGKLKRGWTVTPDDGGVLVENEVEYASYVEEGTSRMDGQFMLQQTIDEVDQILNGVL